MLARGYEVRRAVYYGIVAGSLALLVSGTARAETSDIARALHLYRLACLIEGGLLLGAWLAAHLTLSA